MNIYTDTCIQIYTYIHTTTHIQTYEKAYPYSHFQKLHPRVCIMNTQTCTLDLFCSFHTVPTSRPSVDHHSSDYSAGGEEVAIQTVGP